MLPEQTIMNSLIDIVVRGEGEESFLKIVTALKCGNSLNDIPNIWWKDNDKVYSTPTDGLINLDNLPPLPYQLLDFEKYIEIPQTNLPNCKRIIEVYTERGCCHRCGFCYNINMHQCKWRALAASKVVEQIECLVKNFALDGINFNADNFFVDKKRVADICAGIIKRKIKISWQAGCRIDYFARYDNSFIDLLIKSGCRKLNFGLESGSQRILNLIQKDMNLDDVFKVNAKLKKWQIRVDYDIMAGFPEETKEEVLQTYKIMFRLHHEYPKATFFGPYIYTPYPGTPLYDKCLEMGFNPPERLEDWANFEWCGKTYLSFINPSYSKWLKKSASILRLSFIHVKGLQWMGWWFKVRAKIIIKFNIIGPIPEEKVIHFAKIIIAFVKKLLRVK